MIAAVKGRKEFTKLEVDSQNHSNRNLANIANVSIVDEEFINNVNCDIDNFLKQRYNNSVLLFPPVNNFRRFLIHQTCDNFRNKYDLFTFSVGQGPFRRTVICFKKQLLYPHIYKGTAVAAHFETRHKSSTPTLLRSWRSDNRRTEASNFLKQFTAAAPHKNVLNEGVEKNTVENKINKSEDLYRPLALLNDEKMFKRDEEEPVKVIANGISQNIEMIEPILLSSPAANVRMPSTTSISCSNSPIHIYKNVMMNNLTTSIQQYSACKSQQHVDEQSQRQKQTIRERRPDRAVYIPRARRSQTTPPNTPTTQTQLSTRQQKQSKQLSLLVPTKSDEPSKNLNQQLAISLDETTTASVRHKPSSKTVEVGSVYSGMIIDNISCNNSTKTINKTEKLNKEGREQRRQKRLLKKLSTVSTQHIQNQKNNEKLNENSINTISNYDDGDEVLNQALISNIQQIHQSSLLNSDVNNFNEINYNINNLSKGFNYDEQTLNNKSKLSANKREILEFDSLPINSINDTEFVNNFNSNTFKSRFPHKPAQSTGINYKNTASNTMPKSSMKIKSNKTNSSAMLDQMKLPNLRIEDVASQSSPTKCDVEEQEFQRASKKINRSNRRIIKRTFISDILQIPDHVNEEENEDKTKAAEDNKEPVESHTTTQIDNFMEDEEDEDDWENMFDDSGDCLDPKIMQELTASVGKCKIELPKMDYSAFLTKQSILNEEEFPHVLEVSNFPVEFKNQDLLMVFSQYKESGFDIKWVDDTHALAVFSSSRIAAEVLTMGHPFVVLKPLAEATIESRLKAKKCAAALQPYRPRPETCAALARRLVTGALGVRLKTATAERENEKRVLREAKERKLLASKQRDEIWDS